MGNSDILRQLQSSRIEERRSAAKFLAEFPVHYYEDRDKRDLTYAIPDLLVLLSDEDPIVRKYSLGAIHSAQLDHQAINPAIPAVIGLLFNEAEQDQEVRGEAARILNTAAIGRYVGPGTTNGGLFNYTSHLNQLRELLSERNGSRNWNAVKPIIAHALSFYFMRSGEWSEVAALLNHRDREVRREAADALSEPKLVWLRIPNQRSFDTWSDTFDMSPVIPDLIKRLSDRSKDVRLAVARALSTRGKEANGYVDFSLAVPVLIDISSDKSPVYRLRAAQIIQELILDVCHHNHSTFKAIPAASREALAPLIPALKRAISGPNKRVRETAAETLTQYLAHTGQFQELTFLLDSKMAPQMKHELIWALPCGDWRDCDCDISPLIPTLVSLVSVRAGSVGVAARHSLYEFVEHGLSLTGRTERASLIHVEMDKADLTVNAKRKLRRKIRDIVNEAPTVIRIMRERAARWRAELKEREDGG